MAREFTALLPDFIFVRDRGTERRDGLLLAGTLITDILRSDKFDKNDGPAIVAILEHLRDHISQEPEAAQVGLWRGPMPPDGLDPPFHVEMVKAKAQLFVTIVVRIARGSDGKLDISTKTIH